MSGTHLTTSRINRVLRPLRTKCDKLASIASSSGIRSTYSNGTRVTSTNNNDVDDLPPLYPLQPPETSRSKLQLDAASRKHVELSRCIYAVRDAFKNVVQVAFGPSPNEKRSSTSTSQPMPSRLLTLTSLCSVVVGMEFDVPHNERLERENASNEEGTEEEESSWIDELYDAVPFHVRKWTLVTHALQIILRTCPLHPTLLTCLLEFCLSLQHSLIPHCESLLRSLLTVALSSPSNPNAVTPLPPPICHSAHTSFLCDLKTKWSEKFCNERSFLSVLIDVLAHTSPEAWTSKAIAKLAQDLINDDLTCMIRISKGLVDALATSKANKSRLEKCPDGRKLNLLFRWCQSISDRLSLAPQLEEDVDVCLALLDLIIAYFKSRRPFQALASPQVEDVMICISTWCLAVFPPSFSDCDYDCIVDFLARSSPSKYIYYSLITTIFSSATDEEVPIQSLNQIRSYTSSLMLNGLFELEISFIKQTSRFFADRFTETLGHEPEFEEITEELEKNLEEAERELDKSDGCYLPHDEVLALSADEMTLSYSSPMMKRKKEGKRKRTESGDKFDFLQNKKQRRRYTEGDSRSTSKTQSSSSQRPPLSRNKEPETITISDSDDSEPNRPLVRAAIYKHDSNHTPEVVEVGLKEKDVAEDDADEQLAMSLSLELESASSDDILDLFACTDGSPDALRRPNAVKSHRRATKVTSL